MNYSIPVSLAVGAVALAMSLRFLQRCRSRRATAARSKKMDPPDSALLTNEFDWPFDAIGHTPRADRR